MEHVLEEELRWVFIVRSMTAEKLLEWILVSSRGPSLPHMDVRHLLLLLMKLLLLWLLLLKLLLHHHLR